MTVHSPSHVVYVGELNPPRVWKFEMGSSSSETSMYTRLLFMIKSTLNDNRYPDKSNYLHTSKCVVMYLISVYYRNLKCFNC